MFEFPEVPPVREAGTEHVEADELTIDPALERKLYKEPLEEIQREADVGGPCAEAVTEILGIEDPREFQKLVASIIATSFSSRGHSLTDALAFAETPGGVTSMLDVALIMFVAGMQHERNGGSSDD